jgi:hypothetical protein
MVGSIGAVAIPEPHYNPFCGRIYRLKKDLLGATALDDCELKGNDHLAKAVFRYEEGPNRILQCLDGVMGALREHEATVFASWTDQPDLLDLRRCDPQGNLSGPYVDLLCRFAALMDDRRLGRRGLLFFDQKDVRQDVRTGAALQNYIVRSQSRFVLQKHFVQVPHYTHSSISPGLQIADLVAHLACHQLAAGERPELEDWWRKFSAFAASGGAYSATGSTLGACEMDRPALHERRRSSRRSGRRTRQGSKRR